MLGKRCKGWFVIVSMVFGSVGFGQVLFEDDYSLSQGGMYELCYDVRVRLTETTEPAYTAAVEEVD